MKNLIDNFTTNFANVSIEHQTKGHHGMGLHVRPLVGGRTAAGRFFSSPSAGMPTSLSNLTQVRILDSSVGLALFKDEQGLEYVAHSSAFYNGTNKDSIDKAVQAAHIANLTYKELLSSKGNIELSPSIFTTEDGNPCIISRHLSNDEELKSYDKFSAEEKAIFDKAVPHIIAAESFTGLTSRENAQFFIDKNGTIIIPSLTSSNASKDILIQSLQNDKDIANARKIVDAYTGSKGSFFTSGSQEYEDACKVLGSGMVQVRHYVSGEGDFRYLNPDNPASAKLSEELRSISSRYTQTILGDGIDELFHHPLLKDTTNSQVLNAVLDLNKNITNMSVKVSKQIQDVFEDSDLTEAYKSKYDIRSDSLKRFSTVIENMRQDSFMPITDDYIMEFGQSHQAIISQKLPKKLLNEKLEVDKTANLAAAFDKAKQSYALDEEYLSSLDDKSIRFRVANLVANQALSEGVNDFRSNDKPPYPILDGNWKNAMLPYLANRILTSPQLSGSDAKYVDLALKQSMYYADKWINDVSGSIHKGQSINVRLGFVDGMFGGIPSDTTKIIWGVDPTLSSSSFRPALKKNELIAQLLAIETTPSLKSGYDSTFSWELPSINANGMDRDRMKVLSREAQIAISKLQEVRKSSILSPEAKQSELLRLNTKIDDIVSQVDFSSDFDKPRGISMALNHALTYTVLERTQLPYHDQEKKTALLFRSDSNRRVEQHQKDFIKNIEDGKIADPIGSPLTLDRNVVESFSAFDPKFILNPVLTGQEVPFHRVLNAFYTPVFKGGLTSTLIPGECEYTVITPGLAPQYLGAKGALLGNPSIQAAESISNAMDFAFDWATKRNAPTFADYIINKDGTKIKTFVSIFNKKLKVSPERGMISWKYKKVFISNYLQSKMTFHDVLFQLPSRKGHHGMGLHKRPTVGSGAVAAGTYAGGNSWPTTSDIIDTKPSAPLVNGSDHVAFLNSSEFVAKYFDQKKKYEEHRKSIEDLMEKFKIMKQGSQNNSASSIANLSEFSEHIQRELDAFEETKMAFRAAENYAKAKIWEYLAINKDAKATPIIFEEVPGNLKSKKQESFANLSKDHDIDLFKSHLNEPISWISTMISPQVHQEMQDNITSVLWGPKHLLLQGQKQTLDVPVKLLTASQHKLIARLNDLQGNPDLANENGFHYAVASELYTYNNVPQSVKNIKDLELYVDNMIKQAPTFSQDTLPIRIDLNNTNNSGRGFFANPSGITKTVVLNGKVVEYGVPAPSQPGVVISDMKGWGIHISPKVTGETMEAAMKIFKETYKKPAEPLTTSQIVVKDSFQSLIAHEYGHYLEGLSPSIQKLTQEFLRRRTEGKPILKLKDAIPNSGYSDNEVYKDGGFISPYVGKIYYRDAAKKILAEGSSEVFSMGLQELRNNPMEFLKNDPDHFALIVAAMQGLQL